MQISTLLSAIKQKYIMHSLINPETRLKQNTKSKDKQ